MTGGGMRKGYKNAYCNVVLFYRASSSAYTRHMWGPATIALNIIEEGENEERNYPLPSRDPLVEARTRTIFVCWGDYSGRAKRYWVREQVVDEGNTARMNAVVFGEECPKQSNLRQNLFVPTSHWSIISRIIVTVITTSWYSVAPYSAGTRTFCNPPEGSTMLHFCGAHCCALPSCVFWRWCQDGTTSRHETDPSKLFSNGGREQWAYWNHGFIYIVWRINFAEFIF